MVPYKLVGNKGNEVKVLVDYNISASVTVGGLFALSSGQNSSTLITFHGQKHSGQ